jgi:hypothetical protein
LQLVLPWVGVVQISCTGAFVMAQSEQHRMTERWYNVQGAEPSEPLKTRRRTQLQVGWSRYNTFDPVQGHELPENGGGRPKDWLRSAMTHKRAIPAPGRVQQKPDADTRFQVRGIPCCDGNACHCSGGPHAPMIVPLAL